MSPPTETLQRIQRLAPLAEVMTRLDAVAAPVATREVEPAAAVGATLAADVVAEKMLPPAAAALRDGWAVTSEAILDAGPYAPIPVTPPPVWVEAGQPMPAGTDAVLPADAIMVTRLGAEAHATATAGDGVMPAGGDVAAGATLRKAGSRLRPSDTAVLRAAGIKTVPVRAPRVKIFSVTVPTRSRDDSLSPLIARAVEAGGGVAHVAQAATLESALVDRGCDAVMTIGGTGSGKRDAAVKTLARIGTVELHGFGIAPGETSALGVVDGRPILMLPGRLDGALAAFLLVGRALLAHLSGRNETDSGMNVRLTKKVASTVGIAEVVLMRRIAGGAEPFGAGIHSLQALAAADGWIFVPPESEGLPADATVEMRTLP